jgi:hypothetical protein
MAGLKSFNQKVTEAYDELMEGVDRSNPEDVNQAAAPFLEELKGMELDAESQIPAIQRMKSTLSQVTELVSISLRRILLPFNINFFFKAESVSRISDIEMIGLLLYTGLDPAARQYSAVFSGSTFAKELIESKSVDVRQVVDVVTTEFKFVHY